MPSDSSPRLAPPLPPNKTYIADRLSYPARVTHPTLKGELQQFEVVIHRVFTDDYEDPPALAFRGEANAGDWTGFKTFYADKCQEIIDLLTGETVTNYSDWLRGLKQEIAPVTFKDVADAVIKHYNSKKFYDLSNGEVSHRVDQDGTWIEIDNTSQAEEAMSKLNIEHAVIHLAASQHAHLEDSAGVEPIEVQVYLDGSQRGDTLVCTPCAAGRVDVWEK